MNNGQGSSAEKRTAPKIDMDAPLQTTGTDIPAGTYPGLFVGFGEAQYLKSSFKDEEQLRVPVTFAIRIKDGTVETVDGLIAPPEGGKVNRKSNAHKLLKALANGEDSLWDTKTDGLKPGVKFSDFKKRPCMVVIEMGGKNKDFPTVKGFVAPVDGAKYPTVEEARAAVGASEDVPF